MGEKALAGLVGAEVEGLVGLARVGADTEAGALGQQEGGVLVVADGTTPSGDIKLTVLLQEAFRHCKALGAWGDGTAILEAAGIFPGAPGVVTSDAAGKSFTEQLAAAVGLHRAWDRAPDVMASAVPPVLTS